MAAQLDHAHDPAPVIDPALTNQQMTRKVSRIPLRRRTKIAWLAGFSFAMTLTLLMLSAIGYLLIEGIGIWGINIPVAWGFAIINFVWWIGIGHAGTLISAILLLLRQGWRTSINRFAEAMTLFAVACAGIFPLLHLGRPQFFYWLIPYPNTMGLWPQWNSPLVWDVFAVTTYGTVSLLFWYVGLIPDLATMRDRAQARFAKYAYAILALGWRGSGRHWHRYQMCYLLLAGLATPLVVSVHSIVSLDFTVAIIPGWHSTMFPPYFVAGAVYSGFGMVLTLIIPVRRIYGLHSIITARHLENMAKVMLATGLMVGYGYALETFIAWYSGIEAERYMIMNRMFGPYAPYYWTLLFCNMVAIQVLWFKAIRRNPAALFVISIIVNVGMWLERYIIVVTPLHRDYLPSSWGLYEATLWDWALYIGTLGFFFAALMLFVRLLPMATMFELRELIAHGEQEQSDTTITEAR